MHLSLNLSLAHFRNKENLDFAYLRWVFIPKKLLSLLFS
jgi:hypothetical protein